MSETPINESSTPNSSDDSVSRFKNPSMTYEALNAIQDKLFKESDIGLPILAASILDQKLRKILLGFLKTGKSTKALFEGGNPPLGTFSSCLHLAHALGLISDNEYHDCHLIRKIRNEFAHKFDSNLSFQNATVGDLCREFKLVKISSYYDAVQNNGARFLFIFEVSGLYLTLINREQHAATMSKLKPNPDWESFHFYEGQGWFMKRPSE